MKSFSDISIPLQYFLLIASIISLTLLMVILICSFLKARRLFEKLFLTGVIILNFIVHVLMHANRDLTGESARVELPLFVSIGFIILFYLYLVAKTIFEFKKREKISNRSINEAFDNLTTGVCFFNENGLPVLCNRKMHDFSFETQGKDIQYLNDLDLLLQGKADLIDGVGKQDDEFFLPNGKTFELTQINVTDSYGRKFRKFTVLDITELINKKTKLHKEHKEQIKIKYQLKKLSERMLTVTREEEILQAKMHIHGKMGQFLIMAKKYLQNNTDIPNDFLESWQKSVYLLNIKDNSVTEENIMLDEIYRACDFFNIELVLKGEFPTDENIAYLFSIAVKECLANAARHADAKKIFVNLTNTANSCSVTIENDGFPPKQEISEGGGLSDLRQRIERNFGRMEIEWTPVFKLKINFDNGGNCLYD